MLHKGTQKTTKYKHLSNYQIIHNNIQRILFNKYNMR